MKFEIKDCSEDQLDIVKQHIHQFELDDRSLHYSQFLLALENKTIIGFGRIREHINCSELCSLGVIEPERNKGVGLALTKALARKAKKSVYLVCIIPEFFKILGFRLCDTYPEELLNKLHYCTHELIVPETYVVMKKG
ncbi:MAG: GNAT family N-acetyltransferase [Bacteroidota bacterium]|nr:GNAT family N-acetyltransferase [Bacteroidota bacterium]